MASLDHRQGPPGRVRNAFDHWKAQGIGLEFAEVTSRDEAEIRIGFMQGDGPWSYLGRQILDRGVNERTMNFGWDLLRSPAQQLAAGEDPMEHPAQDRARHRAGLQLGPGLGHGVPLPGRADPPAGAVPDRSLRPAGGLSPRDLAWVRAFYPAEDQGELPELLPFQSRELAILPGQQRDFVIRPTASRGYTMQTFGESDTVMVLFERDAGQLRYQAGDDDSSEDRNATLQLKLLQGREYVLRIRLYFSQGSGQTAVMMW